MLEKSNFIKEIDRRLLIETKDLIITVYIVETANLVR